MPSKPTAPKAAEKTTETASVIPVVSKTVSKATKTEPKQMDVAKPGATPPPATSKPVIVGHKPMVADPMVQKPTKLGVANEKPVVSSRVKKLEPVSADLKTSTTSASEKAATTPVTSAALASTAEAKTAPPIKPETEKPKSTPKPADQPKPPAPKPDSTFSETTDTELDVQKTKAAASAAAKKQQADADRDAKNQELISSKKYFLKIDEGSSGSVRTFVITVAVILLVGVVAMVVANDAGWVDLGVDMPFDLIK